ncbi:MAG: hypothetical protein WBD40_04470 [Tepidisphaeraceae bacterium]
MTAKQRPTHRRLCHVHLSGIAALAAALAISSPATASAVASTIAATDPPEEILPINPAAEIGPGAVGWTGTPGYTSTRYGARGEFPSPAVSASIGTAGIGGGVAFFDPGHQPDARLAQDVDLARYQSRIINDELNELAVTVWLGGYGSSQDTVDLQVTPLNAMGQRLTSSTRLAGPSATERGNSTAMLQRTGSTLLPPATTRVRVELIATGTPGEKNHGYADEVILSLWHRDGPPPRNPWGSYWGEYPGTMVRFGPGAPAVIRFGRRLLLDPRATIDCSPSPGAARGFTCSTSIVARDARSGMLVAHQTLILRPGQRVVPVLRLTRGARTALTRGESLHATVTITGRLQNSLFSSGRRQRTAVLKLRHPRG